MKVRRKATERGGTEHNVTEIALQQMKVNRPRMVTGISCSAFGSTNGKMPVFHGFISNLKNVSKQIISAVHRLMIIYLCSTLRCGPPYL